MSEICGKPAVAKYLWPTMETICVCAECSRRAVAIASAMGFRLGVLTLEGDETCTQQRSRREAMKDPAS